MTSSEKQYSNMMYGYKCAYCEGSVQPRLVDREVLKHKSGFVILENVIIGVCDTCGNRYYSAEILHTVHQIATGKQKPEWTESIPVARLAAQSLAPIS